VWVAVNVCDNRAPPQYGYQPLPVGPSAQPGSAGTLAHPDPPASPVAPSPATTATAAADRNVLVPRRMAASYVGGAGAPSVVRLAQM